MNIHIRKAAIAAFLFGAGAASALAQGGPGYGYGPGMMGGRGPGYGQGMMGGGWGRGGLASLDLSDEQRDKVLSIQEANRQKNWATMGELRSEMFKLRKMYSADSVDPAAVTEQQKKVDELRRQMLKSRLEGRKEMEAVLTAEQRKQFRRSMPWWMEGDED